MRKTFSIAAFTLLMLGGMAMAYSVQTITIGEQTIAKKVRSLAFEGDSVTISFADSTSQTADMETVRLTFQWNDRVTGDTNNDGKVDVADIATIISVMAASTGTPSGQSSPSADVNGDGTVDVADIASVISIMAAQSRRQAAGEVSQTKWDFTQTIDADVRYLSSAASEWTYDEKNNRYQNLKEINGPLTAGQWVLRLTEGLMFGAAKDKLRIDIGRRVQLAGKNVTVTIPDLKKGQQVTIVFASTGDNAVTFDANTNLTDAGGFAAADKNTTQTGKATVAEDGAVSFKSTGGSINVFSIEVSEAPEAPETPENTDITANAVARNIFANQALLTLTTGDVKYYNTASVGAIGIDDVSGLVTVSMNNQQQDLYHASIAAISFAKKQDNGQEVVIDNGCVEVTEAQGWQESLYAKWELTPGAKSYNVFIAGGQYADWTKVDEQLVRNYGTYGRVDVVGLPAGQYELKVEPVWDASEGVELPTCIGSIVTGLTVKGYPRQGFAFMGGIVGNASERYNYSPGAYNADGSLKQGAKVFYVTKNTAKTIKTTVVTDAKGGTTECTGLQAIIAAYEKGCDTTPIAFRFIGLVEKDNLDAIGSSEEGIQVKGRKADSELNITFEGIGDDATLRGFGFLVRNAKSVEFRNLAIMRCMDDGISLDTDNSNIWVHHCDFFYGKHGSGDHDKGDGQVDVKSNSKYVTVSYNRFWDTGKTNMFGMKSESGPNYISYDHNWFDHSDSRHPRVRTMSVHVWNNYFDNVAKYGVGATTGSSVFVENNYFLKTKKPILNSLQGTDALGSGTFSDEQPGFIKAFGNYIDRSAAHFSYYTQKNPASTGFDAYETASRDEQITEDVMLTYFAKKNDSGKIIAEVLTAPYAYDNFDTNPQLMYDYTVDAAEDVPAIVMGYYGAGRLNHGDFQYTFKDNVGIDDDDSAYDATLGGLLDSYKSSLVGFFGEATTPVDPDDPDDPVVPEGTILASFDSSPSSSLFTVGGNYGDGKITYDGTYYKKGVKLDSKGSITFTPTKNYQMTLILATAKSGRDVKLNGEKTTVSGTENAEGAYYEMQPISITAGKQYVLTKGTAESIVMLIKLVPTE